MGQMTIYFFLIHAKEGLDFFTKDLCISENESSLKIK